MVQDYLTTENLGFSCQSKEQSSLDSQQTKKKSRGGADTAIVASINSQSGHGHEHHAPESWKACAYI